MSGVKLTYQGKTKSFLVTDPESISVIGHQRPSIEVFSGKPGEKGDKGDKGDQGDPGAPGSSNDLTSVDFVATADVPAFSPVIANGVVADNTVLAHRQKVIGISTTHVSTGFAGKAISAGQIQNPSWSWVIGDRIYIVGNTLSNTAPSTGLWSQEVGIANAANSIVVNIKFSILL